MTHQVLCGNLSELCLNQLQPLGILSGKDCCPTKFGLNWLLPHKIRSEATAFLDMMSNPYPTWHARSHLFQIALSEGSELVAFSLMLGRTYQASFERFHPRPRPRADQRPTIISSSLTKWAGSCCQDANNVHKQMDKRIIVECWGSNICCLCVCLLVCAIGMLWIVIMGKAQTWYIFQPGSHQSPVKELSRKSPESERRRDEWRCWELNQSSTQCFECGSAVDFFPQEADT